MKEEPSEEILENEFQFDVKIENFEDEVNIDYGREINFKKEPKEEKIIENNYQSDNGREELNGSYVSVTFDLKESILL